MNAFVATMFVLFVINVLVSLVRLVAAEYPRERDTVSVGFDAASLILELAALAWTAYLLWGRA